MSDIETINEMQAELSHLRELIREMREALNNLEVTANSVAYCYSNRPENFAYSLECLRYDAITAKGMTAKADAALKGEPVRYGCHVDEGEFGMEVFDDCLEADCSLVGHGEVTGKEDCPHWKPIQVVKYGCHINNERLGDVVLDECSDKCELISHGEINRKEDCKYWKPIQS